MTTTTKALELAGLKIYSDGTNEIEWLAARRGLYTATQVTAICGSNPYTKLIDVWNGFTDPDFDPDAERNRYLEERAAFGQLREPEIIKWASEDDRTGGPRNPFIPSHALVGLPEHEGKRYASTPDGYKFARDNALVLIEAKASQQDWESDGLPQHIYDQTQWQIYTTGAVTVWVAQERIEWVGRGANKQPKVISQHLFPVQRDQRRIDWMLSRVEWFEGLYKAGIAPESDIDLRTLEAPSFDANLDEIEEWEQLIEADILLTELADVRERMAADIAREAELVNQLKPIVKQYEGRRIHLIGSRFIAKLVRGTRTDIDKSKIDPDTLRAAITWKESETVKFEPNPEYTPAIAEGDNATESE